MTDDSWMRSPGGLLATMIYELAPVDRLADLNSDPAFRRVHAKIVAYTNQVVVEERDRLMARPLKAPHGDHTKINWWRVLKLHETSRTINTIALGDAVLEALAIVTPDDPKHHAFHRDVVNPPFWK